MTRGYQTEEIKEKLVDLLSSSKTGLSGLEISERLNINRITTTKYLNVFAAEGFVKQKNIGNVNLWFIEDGTEKFHFPEDFFKVKKDKKINKKERQIDQDIKQIKSIEEAEEWEEEEKEINIR